MEYGDVVKFVAKRRVVNALVARSVEIAPHSPADGKPVKDQSGEALPAEEHVDLVYLDPEANDQKGGPMLKVRELRHVAVSSLEKMIDAAMRASKVAAMLLVFLLSMLPAMAQQSGQQPVRWTWATDYATSVLMGTQPNTYTWSLGAAPGPGSCVVAPTNGGPPFFIFGTNAKPYPQYIRDASATLNEVFTPSGTSLTGSTCGFSGSPTYQHTTFWVSSGTAGLYEAVQNNIVNGAAGYYSVVLLDNNWYRSIASMGLTASTVLGSTTMPGSAKVQIVDTTQTPWAWYAWSGTQYLVASSGTAPTLAGANTFSAVNVFQNTLTSFGVASTTTGTLRLYSSGAAFTTTITPSTTPTGSYTFTIPVLGANDSPATLKLGNVFTGVNVF